MMGVHRAGEFAPARQDSGATDHASRRRHFERPID